MAEKSAAEKAGFKVGDILLSMDGQETRERDSLNRLMAGKRWGDSAVFAVRRGEQEVSLTAFFRRKPASYNFV